MLGYFIVRLRLNKSYSIIVHVNFFGLPYFQTFALCQNLFLTHTQQKQIFIETKNFPGSVERLESYFFYTGF